MRVSIDSIRARVILLKAVRGVKEDGLMGQYERERCRSFDCV
jgi:hypothetical protein